MQTIVHPDSGIFRLPGEAPDSVRLPRVGCEGEYVPQGTCAEGRKGGGERRSRNNFYRIALDNVGAVRHQACKELSYVKGGGRGDSGSLSRLLNAQEEAARRVAQQLHDECDQLLAMVYLELGIIARDSPGEVARKIAGVVKLLDEVGVQTRRLSHELRPPLLDQLGLVPALQFLAEGFSRRWNLELVVSGQSVDLSPETRIVVYRVVQEALSNVARHAGATKAEVRLWVSGEKVHCVVSDNGVGFTVPEADRADHGLGLVGIYERVTALGGNCSIVSCRRRGSQFTELRVEVPL